MKHHRLLILIVVGWYLILALGHYFDQRPLWHDELCVLNNIICRHGGSLFTEPLIDYQAFPRLYLLAIQQFSQPFNQNILILRLFPLMAMIGAFFVWFNIARRVLSHSWDLVLFIGCWCGSLPLVYHAAELKPYSMDVLAAGLIVLFLLDQNAKNGKKNGDSHHSFENGDCHHSFYFFLPWLCLWSYPAIFLLLLPLYNLCHDCFEKRRWLPELSFYLGGCALILGLLYFFDFRVSLRYFLEVFWHDYFISVHSFKDFLATFGKGMNNLISRRFAESPRWVKVPSRVFIGLGVGYMLLAFWDQYKKDRFILRSITSISFAMFLIQWVLAVLRIYPFAVPRMSLFFSPLLFLMTIMAMGYIGQRRKVWGGSFGFFSGYLVFVSLGIAWDVFIKRDLGAESTLYSPG